MANLKQTFGGKIISNVQRYSPAFTGQNRLNQDSVFVSAQQQHRFFLLIDNLPAAFITQVDRPSYTISTQEQLLLDHVVRYPIRLKWEPINFTIREILDNSDGTVGANLMNKLLAQNYYYPDDVNSPTAVQDLTAVSDPVLAANDVVYGTKNLSKENLVRSLGNVKILSLKPDGSTVETWELFNAMIVSLKFSQFGYNGESLTDIAVSVQYDWAKLSLG
tara:strand:+ start:526 stop:1182 length:657 start_codon:yes stop_codon:yes gene_type:complete